MTSAPMRIQDGAVVTLNYTLRTGDGETLHDESANEPMTYVHGSNSIVPGLERWLTGKGAGDRLSVTVPPGEAYGERRGPGPQPVPRSAFSEMGELSPGVPVEARGPGGETLALWIVEVGPETVHVDANHPLAGVTLHFSVEIMAVRAASERELREGRPE